MRCQRHFIEAFKMINGYYDVTLDLFFFTFDDAERSGHSKKLFKRRSRLDIREGSVFFQTELWINRMYCLTVACMFLKQKLNYSWNLKH